MFFVFQENLRFLNFLKEPCEKLAEATPPEIPAILPELLNYVRCQLSMGSWAIASVQPVTCLVEHFPHCQSLLCSVCLPWHHQHWSVHICHVTMSHWRPSFFSAGMIWSISTHYQKEDRISGLLRKMSNEIIKRCDLARWPTADHGRRWPELIRSWIWRSVAVGGCIVAFYMLAACSKQCTLVEVLVRPKGQSKAGLHKSAWLRISKRAYCLFPTSLCGVLVFGSALPPSPPRPPPAHSSHTTCPHTTYSHTTYSYTTWPHTTYSHNLLTHILTNTTWPHTTYSHTRTTCHHTTWPQTTCSHTTCPHTTSSHTTWPHATCSHNLLTHNLTTRNLLTQLVTIQLVAGVALGDIDLHFAWQAWHLWHWTGSGGALGSPFGAVVAAAVGVAGVALGDIDLHFALAWYLYDIDRHFAWQVWHLATWTCILRGRRGTYRTGLAPVACLGWVWCRGRRRREHRWYLSFWALLSFGREVPHIKQSDSNHTTRRRIHTSIHPSIHTYIR